MFDQEMPDEPLPLERDLSCPVCQEIYRDPVLLSCTHSFCRECLDRSWALKKRCPVCRQDCKEEQPTTNRALSSACESFLLEKSLRQPSKSLGPYHCRLHLKEFQLFCVKDEEPVCVDCVTLHPVHDLLPVNQGASLCKREVAFKVEIIENKLEAYKTLKQKFDNTVEFIKRQAGQAEVQIKAEFDRLRTILSTEEQARLKALADEETRKIADINSLIDETSNDIDTLKKLIENLKREMGGEDLYLVKNFQDLKRKAQWIKDDPQFPQDGLLDMARHVGSLGFNIWKSMQSQINFHPVVMNPNTASPWLSLNPQLTAIKESPERQVTPDNPDRFDPCVFVLGAPGFTSGKHRWEVNVGNNPKWILGVCKDSVPRKKKFTVSTDRAVWTISLSKGVYYAMTPKRETLAVESRPDTIRIKLNMDKGEVSFWDAGTSKHLCTFAHNFSGSVVYPIFGPGLNSTPMVLVPGKMTIHT